MKKRAMVAAGILGIAGILLFSRCDRSGPGKTPARDGSIDLFNGKDLLGWTMIGRGDASVKDGLLWIRGGTGEKACLAYAGRTFGDFTLLVEWMVPAMDGDSGIFLRIPGPLKVAEGERPSSGDAVRDCYEVQIHDGSQAITPTGHVVDVWEGEMSEERASKPPGEWNRFEITAAGQSYTVMLNGVKMHEFAGKKGKEGHIGLQSLDRPSTVCFRRIAVKELSRG